MLTQSLIAFAALVLATVSSAKPVPEFQELAARRKHHSFNKYNGWDFMSHFDDFYGVDNYSGSSLTFVKEKEVVCKSQSVVLVQQRLAVLQEYYKKIITTQVCKVEAQVIVHNQFVSGCNAFSRDLRRGEGHRDVTFDFEMSSKIVEIQNKGECVIKDWGWKGDVIGKHACKYSGDNWNEQTSHISVGKIYDSCQQAVIYSSPWYHKYYKGGYNDYKGYKDYKPNSYTYVDPPKYTSSPSYDYGYDYKTSTYVAPPTYTAPSYEKPSYGYDDKSYGYDKSSYGYDKSSYGSDKSSYGYDKSSYGSDKSSYGYDKSSYGSDKSYDDKSYGYDKSYGSDKSYGYEKPSYDKPSYDKPSYEKPSYGYGYDKPSYEKPSYEKPSYGYSSEPAYVAPSMECESCGEAPSVTSSIVSESVPSAVSSVIDSAPAPEATDIPVASGDPAEGTEIGPSPAASSTDAAAPAASSVAPAV